MTVVHAFPAHGDVLFDVRDAGRALRIGWHPHDGLVVFSIWRHGSCVSTFRLARADVPRVITQLAEGLAAPPTPDWTTPRLVESAPRPRWPRPGARPRWPKATGPSAGWLTRIARRPDTS